MGLLGWPPSEFWGARVMDIMDAVDGSLMRQGVMPPDVEREIKSNETAMVMREIDILDKRKAARDG